jgi:hypothetical protein
VAAALRCHAIISDVRNVIAYYLMQHLLLHLLLCFCAAGAYQGRGRGNAFLGDLCDADVLVHVVDASGTTDSKGVAMSADPGTQAGNHQDGGKADAGGEDPIEEVRWATRQGATA